MKLIVRVVFIILCVGIGLSHSFAVNNVRVGCPEKMDVIPTFGYDSIAIPIYITNDVDLGAFCLGFSWSGDSVTISSVVKGPIIPISGSVLVQVNIRPVEKSVLLGFIDLAGSHLLVAQTNGLAFTMYLRVPSGTPAGCIDIDSAFVDPVGRFLFWKFADTGFVPTYTDCGNGEVKLAFIDSCPPNQKPVSHIDYITPNPAFRGETVTFIGHGDDSDGTVKGYYWGSFPGGQSLSTQASFSTSSLSPGNHYIYFRVLDNSGAWSRSAVEHLLISDSSQSPIAYIRSITPNPAVQGENVTFEGFGLESDGTIINYNWRSSIDGQLSTAASFSSNLLSVGIHTIYFKVEDDSGVWSPEVSAPLEILPAGSQRNLLSAFNHFIREVGQAELLRDSILDASGNLLVGYNNPITFKIIEGNSYSHLDPTNDTDPTQEGIQMIPQNGTASLFLIADQVGGFTLIEASGENLAPDTLLIYIGGYPDMGCSVRSSREIILPDEEVTFAIDYGNIGLCAAHNVVLIDSLYDPNLKYVSGSAIVTGMGAHLEYSTNFGATWSLNEPSTGLTTLKWVIPSYSLTGNPSSSEVHFKMKAIANPTLGKVITNAATISADYVTSNRNTDNVQIATNDFVMAAKYAPVLCINSSSRYKPTRVEWIDGNANLLKTADQSTLIANVDPLQLGAYTGNALPLPVGSTYIDFVNRDKPIDRFTVYSRIVTEGSKTAIQYWLFYPYNDWVNSHEGDWEMTQVVLGTGSETPEYVVYAQHKSKERATWPDIVNYSGTFHPVVYVADGSHASYFSSGIHHLQPHHSANELWMGFANYNIQSLNFACDALTYLGASAAIVASAYAAYYVVAAALSYATAWAVTLLIKSGADAAIVTAVANQLVLESFRQFGIWVAKNLPQIEIGALQPLVATKLENQKQANQELVNNVMGLNLVDIAPNESNDNLIRSDRLYGTSITNEYDLSLLSDNLPWIAYNGHWGEVTRVLNDPDNFISAIFSGPMGPKYGDETYKLIGADRWEHPITWANQGGAGPMLQVQLACPAQLHVYDKFGFHCGASRSGSGFDWDIPYSMFVDEVTADSFPQTAFVVYPEGDYTVKVVGTGAGQVKLSSKVFLEFNAVDSNSVLAAIDSGQVLVCKIMANCEGDSCMTVSMTQLSEAIDSMPPIILKPDITGIQTCVSVFDLSFFVQDSGLGVDRSSVQVFLDGKEQFVTFDTLTLEHHVAVPCQDSLRPNLVRIEASDIAGNKSAAEFRLFVCGDADGEGTINIADAVYLISYIFSHGPVPSPLAAGDADCSGDINIADCVYLISYIFSHGAAPCAGCK